MTSKKIRITAVLISWFIIIALIILFSNRGNIDAVIITIFASIIPSVVLINIPKYFRESSKGKYLFYKNKKKLIFAIISSVVFCLTSGWYIYDLNSYETKYCNQELERVCLIYEEEYVDNAKLLPMWTKLTCLAGFQTTAIRRDIIVKMQHLMASEDACTTEECNIEISKEIKDILTYNGDNVHVKRYCDIASEFKNMIIDHDNNKMEEVMEKIETMTSECAIHITIWCSILLIMRSTMGSFAELIVQLIASRKRNSCNNETTITA